MENTDECLLFQSEKTSKHGALVDKWTVPPFSVLDTRQGYWTERKKFWLSLGIESELGRDEELTYRKLDPEKYKTAKYTNKLSTSVFDPVLCEVLLRWFSRPGSRVLDPFAGGSVRGIIAGSLGRKYTGIELRSEQVIANRQQTDKIKPERIPDWYEGDSSEQLMKIHIPSDFILSCPPYADLEVYSDDPRDLSNMEYDEFLSKYERIIELASDNLNDHRFACFVVSEVRNKKTGIYRGFVPIQFERSKKLDWTLQRCCDAKPDRNGRNKGESFNANSKTGQGPSECAGVYQR